MSIPIGVQLERDQALQDVSEIINEYGNDVVLYVHGETGVTRDKYGSIIAQATTGTGTIFYLKAYPVDHRPNRIQMEKAGIREACECIIWFSMLDITTAGLSFDEMESEKITVTVDGNDYKLSEKAKVNPYGDAFLYLTMGLSKKP